MLNLDRSIVLGTLITLAGSLLYVVMGMLSKKIGLHLAVNQIIFLQSVSGLICAACFVKIKKYRWCELFTKHSIVYVLRIAMSLGSVYALIYGLQHINIFNALIILNSVPLVIPFLRKLFFKTRIHPGIFPAILIGFTGLIMILSPDRHIIDSPMLLIIVSMLCLAFSLLLLDKNYRTDPNLSIFYYFLYSSLVTSCIVISEHQTQIGLIDLPLGIVIGILFFFIQLSVIFASQYISSQLISVLFYAEIIMALCASIIFENLHFTYFLAIGTLLVLLGGIGAVLIENQEKK